jgi:hypothetical protein
MGDSLNGVVGVCDHRPFGADAKVDPAAGIGLVRAAGRLGRDRGHRDEEPTALLAEGHRQHPGLALGEQPLEPPGVLFAAEPADDWEGEMAAVGLQPQSASGEPDPATVLAAGLEPGESNPGTGPAALL